MATDTKSRPAWVELATDDPAAAREFYSKLLGWDVVVSDDPQYGGYAMARLADDEGDVAGITAKMMPEAPTAWSLYIGTDDAAALGDAVQAAGGTVMAPAFDVGDMGRMAVFADPTGAVISAWQAAGPRRFRTGDVGTMGWAELNSRGIDKATDFYGKVFGWTAETSPMGEGQPDYTTFKVGDEGIVGGLEMMPMVPAEVPSYWMVYFNVPDVDAAFTKAIELGATEMVAPSPMPGGRFAIVNDPQGAMFGLLKTDQG
jgi:predicted enzyme related to lactoylglutathione lyase